MTLGDENKAALQEIVALKGIRKGVAETLRDQAKAARLRGDKTLAHDLSTQATQLNQQNFRISHTLKKFEVRTDVSTALAGLRGVISDARKVETELANGAALLKQASKLIEIIVRLSNLFR